VAGVKTRYEVTPLEGLQRKIGDKIFIKFALVINHLSFKIISQEEEGYQIMLLTLFCLKKRYNWLKTLTLLSFLQEPTGNLNLKAQTGLISDYLMDRIN